MTVKINITNNYKKEKLPENARELVRKAVRAVLKCEKFNDNAEVEVTFVSDEEIKEMNAEFRDMDKSTDVLSFPLGENGEYDVNPENDCLMLGDIVISVDHAKYQADLYGHGTDREIAFLTIHSMLHLLGYDHVNNEEEEKLMRQKQNEALEVMGLSLK